MHTQPTSLACRQVTEHVTDAAQSSARMIHASVASPARTTRKAHVAGPVRQGTLVTAPRMVAVALHVAAQRGRVSGMSLAGTLPEASSAAHVHWDIEEMA